VAQTQIALQWWAAKFELPFVARGLGRNVADTALESSAMRNDAKPGASIHFLP